MRRSRDRLGILAAAALGLFVAASARGAGREPADADGGEGRPARGAGRRDAAERQGVVIPLPQAANRVEAADRARIRVTAALPASWSAVSTRYQPYWSGVQPCRGVRHRELVAVVRGQRLRSGPLPAPLLLSLGSPQLRRLDVRPLPGDLGRRAIRRTTALTPRSGCSAAIAPCSRIGRVKRRRRTAVSPRSRPICRSATSGSASLWRSSATTTSAAASLRQAIDRYPGWLPPSVDWIALVGDGTRMARLLADDRGTRGTGGQG